ncbi:hypothetical protein [Streptomyces sp. NPDC093071]|uniref:hypothetical protein n=1 Tax=Streptomyces sp. NPDC093071 TaxID=3366022 RepID=UPI0038178811
MRILLQYGPDHGRTLTTDQPHAPSDEVHVAFDLYVYLLTDKEDALGRPIAEVHPD